MQDIEFQYNGTYLTCTVRGPLTMDKVNSIFNGAERYSWVRLRMYDLRNTAARQFGPDTVTEIAANAMNVFPDDSRIALVMSSEREFAITEFFSAGHANSDTDARAFTDLDEADAWLRSQARDEGTLMRIWNWLRA